MQNARKAFNLGTAANGTIVRNKTGGKLLLELNRILRPGGYFVWSATPVYRTKDPEEMEIWEGMRQLRPLLLNYPSVALACIFVIQDIGLL